MLLKGAAAWFLLGRRLSSLTEQEQHDHAADRCKKHGYNYINRLKRVRKGHFAVLAFEEGSPRRFVVPLAYLTSPAFLKLLEKAQDEYGFEQHGVLRLPCHKSELEGVLHELRHGKNNPWPDCLSKRSAY